MSKFRHGLGPASERQRQENEAAKGKWPVARIIPGQAPKARCPAKGTLYAPAFGQWHEALFDVVEFDDFQFNTLGLGHFGGYLTGVALIDVSQRDVLAGDAQHFLG